MLVWLPKIKYLGHIIAKEGVKANPANIVSTLNWPFHGHLKSLRGFAAYAML